MTEITARNLTSLALFFLSQLMEERQKNHLLEKTLGDYQDELKESYKIIIELRY